MKPQHRILLHKIKVFGFEKISSYWDALLFFLGVPAIAKSNLPNVLLFVGEHLQPRIPRMAKWIKRESDYTLILVCHRRWYVKEFSDPCFSAVYQFRNVCHLKRILKQINNITLVHGFAPKSYFSNVARTFLNKPYVHDMQDVWTIYYNKNTKLNWLKKELPHEAECLIKADGVVANSMEINEAYRQLKCKKKPKTIFFPLYCDDDFFQENNKTIDPDNIHLVYAGSVAGSYKDPAQYGNTQFHNLIKTLTEQKLHFHIYPSPSNSRADYEEYEKIDKQNPYFHFHAPIAQQQLAKELSKYHFGIHLGFVNDNSHKQSPLKYKLCITLKLFNYMESGIPTIISNDLEFQSFIVRRYKTGISVSKNEINTIKSILLQLDYVTIANNIKISREKLGLKRNIKRLLNFYTSKK